MLTVRLSDEADTNLANLSRSTGKPKSDLVREAISAYLTRAGQFRHWQASGATTLAAAQDALNNVGEYQYDIDMIDEEDKVGQ